MKFFTEGKTNWQYISIVLVLAILLSGGILAWQYWWGAKEEVPLPAVPGTVECKVDSDCVPCGSGCAPIEISRMDPCHVNLELNECVCIDNKCVVKGKVIITPESTLKNCDLYEMPMSQEEINECTCPEGYEKFHRLSGAYCATNSQKPCSTHTDCPKGEQCISGDRKDWFCTGQFAGCYYRNPENPEEPMLCAD